MNNELKFPELKTFYQEVEDIARSWARQNNCSYEEATAVVLDFAKQIHAEQLTNKKRGQNE